MGRRTAPGPLDKSVHFFYEKLQFMGSKRPGRNDGRTYATDLPPRTRGMETPHDVSESEIKD
jgi:hypothetical protein